MAIARAPVEGPPEFELYPNRYPDAVGLPGVLEELSKTEEGRATIGRMFETITEKTGIVVPPAVVEEAKRHPKKMMQALEMSPQEMSDTMKRVNHSYQEGELQNPAREPQLLPQKFNFEAFAAIESPARAPALKDIGSGLFVGTLPSATSDEQVKKNRVMAETLERLVNNASVLDPSQAFEVTYQGRPYTTLHDFVGALVADGYSLTVKYESQVADFAKLRQQVPGSNPPKYLDVPAPLMVKTGYLDGANQMAMTPATHSGMRIEVRGPNPNLNANVNFYQGTTKTGFFAADTDAKPTWLGGVTHAEYTGEQARDSIEMAGALTDLIRATAEEFQLYAEGYGVTGVCKDSIALIHHAVAGHSDVYYPLLMQDNLLTKGLMKKLNDTDTSNDDLMRRIQAAIGGQPSDVEPNTTAPARAVASLPWVFDRTPFKSSDVAVSILNAHQRSPGNATTDAASTRPLW